MTRREELQEAYEDAMFALLMDYVAESEGEKALEEIEKSIMFEKKPSLWQKFKKSKFARAISYVFKIRIRIELPNALPEGRGE